MEPVQQKLSSLAKWNPHRYYSRYPCFARYLSPTALLTPESLEKFLRLYKVVYIKASNVHTRKVIIKAWKTDKGYKFVTVRVRTQLAAASTHDLYRRVRSMYPQRTFIVELRGKCYQSCRNRKRRFRCAQRRRLCDDD